LKIKLLLPLFCFLPLFYLLLRSIREICIPFFWKINNSNMKCIVVLGDGMADERIPSLGNRTPLQAARTPSMDELACRGRSGILQTIPPGLSPGSEVANLSVLGYDPRRSLEGRGSLEAASMGVPIGPGELVLRCNLICVEDGKIKNHSAGHVSTEEAKQIISDLNEHLLVKGGGRFFPGVSYRHLLKLASGSKQIICTPPHDVPNRRVEEALIRPETEEAKQTADCLNHLILWSQELLDMHPVNVRRRAEGKDPANSIWPWSPGYRPQMQPLTELYPIASGAVISAVDLIKGIGIYAGLEVIDVPGATGLYDTNYEGKAQAALDALREKDFVFLHVEASDEAGHEGNVPLKIQTIESLDSRILKTVLEETDRWAHPVTIALLPDHPTPCRLRTHSADPSPFVIFKPGETPDTVLQFNEYDARQGAYGELKGDEFIKALFR
jgi:2,3-bisphosphoglycerate-independent phosphoglycerate mutase